ncbi:hypothetical protein [Antarcticirhabdus aurantiaca]|uniref:hypothetical protein n=1 Tax=Antarcticirhabdus aurantiaca TaxID=2606717 RepID=UPI00131D3B6F|nr:hypothetical protein [Antarcticirhabdus aurantiaca]
MADETRIFLNPIAIEYDTVNGRPLRYHRHWRNLDLRIEAYTLQRSLGSMQRSHASEEQAGDDALLSAAYSDYESMSLDDKKRLQDIQTREIVPSKQREAWHLVGWATIANKRDIRVFSAGRKGKPQGDYDQFFRRVKVGIKATGDADEIGSLFLSRPDELSRMRDDETEDHVYLHLPVRAEVLEKLSETIAATGAAPELRLYVDALLYQTEVDEALSEPWQRQWYAMLEDDYPAATLAHLYFEHAKREKPAEPVPEDDEPGVDVPAVVAAIGASAGETAVARRVRGLTVAVWGLAAAVVVAAILG